MTQTPKFSTRKHMSIGILALALLVFGFGGWAVFTKISGAIIASGRIEVDQNRQIVQHPDGGVVQEILVDEGEMVTVDQILIKLDPTQLRAELAIIEGQLFEIMSRRGRLMAEQNNKNVIEFDPLLLARADKDDNVRELVEGQKRLFDARRVSVANEIDQLGKRRTQTLDQINGIEAQQTALSKQLSLIEQELDDQTTLLDKGLAQAARVLGLQREQARLMGQMGELTAQKAQSEGRVTEIDLEIIKLASQRREEAITRLRDQQFRELELMEQRLAILDRLDRLDVKAPANGIVYGLSVFTPRSVVRPADPLLYIIPQDRPLVIASRILPTDIDKVYVGQEVTLRLSALDQKTTPELVGHVSLVSADAFDDKNSGVSYYRAEIRLDAGELSKLPPNTTLVPGMPVDSYIRTQDRTPLSYLVKPLTDYFAKAMREG